MQAAILPDLLRFASRDRTLSELDDLSALGLTQAAPNTREDRRGTSPATDLEN